MVIRTPGRRRRAADRAALAELRGHVRARARASRSSRRRRRATPTGMLKSAIRDDDPGALRREPRALQHDGRRCREPRRTSPCRSDGARSCARARDLTIVAHSYTVRRALTVADRLATEGSRSRSSTCARCGRSTPRRSCASVAQDEPRADRRGGLVDLRRRRRARGAHPARLLRRSRRARRARRRRRGADAVRQAARARRARRRGQDRGRCARAARRVRPAWKGFADGRRDPRCRASPTPWSGGRSRAGPRRRATRSPRATCSPTSRPTRRRWSSRAYENGVLLKILVQEGESAELGAPIALVGEAGETVDGPAAERRCAGGRGRGCSRGAGRAGRRRLGAAEAAERAAPDRARPAPQANGGGELRASPIARRMAADAGPRPAAARRAADPARRAASSRSTSSACAAEGAPAARRPRRRRRRARRRLRLPSRAPGRAPRARADRACSGRSRGA